MKLPTLAKVGAGAAVAFALAGCHPHYYGAPARGYYNQGYNDRYYYPPAPVPSYYVPQSGYYYAPQQPSVTFSYTPRY